MVADDRGHGGAGPPIVLFHYASGRGQAHPLKFLAKCRGRFLQCDAYQSYTALNDIARHGGPWQLVYCWTHVRRRFVKRLENEGSPIAEAMLRQIALLCQSRNPCAPSSRPSAWPLGANIRRTGPA